MLSARFIDIIISDWESTQFVIGESVKIEDKTWNMYNFYDFPPDELIGKCSEFSFKLISEHVDFDNYPIRISIKNIPITIKVQNNKATIIFDKCESSILNIKFWLSDYQTKIKFKCITSWKEINIKQ